MSSKFDAHITLLKDLQISLKQYQKSIKDSESNEIITTNQLQFLKISKSLCILFKNQPKNIHLNPIKREADNLIKAYHDISKNRMNIENETEVICSNFEEDKEIYNNSDEVNDKVLQIRNEEILRLHKDIAELNAIFKDLANLTQEQGEMLTQIQVEVSNAQATTERTVNDLTEASFWQKQS